jgi:hypothetical protein
MTMTTALLGKLLTVTVWANVATLVPPFAEVWFTHHLESWAPALNTLLLIVLTVVARRNGTRTDQVHESVHSTAQVALTAAQAAAEAERVTKAIGGWLRENGIADSPPPPRPIPPAPGEPQTAGPPPAAPAPAAPPPAPSCPPSVSGRWGA